MSEQFPNTISTHIAKSYIDFAADMQRLPRHVIECRAPAVESDGVVVPILGATNPSQFLQVPFTVTIDQPDRDLVCVTLETGNGDPIGAPYYDKGALFGPNEILAKIEHPMGFAALVGALDVSSIEEDLVNFGLYGDLGNSPPVLISQNDGGAYDKRGPRELMQVLYFVTRKRLRREGIGDQS